MKNKSVLFCLITLFLTTYSISALETFMEDGKNVRLLPHSEDGVLYYDLSYENPVEYHIPTGTKVTGIYALYTNEQICFLYRSGTSVIMTLDPFLVDGDDPGVMILTDVADQPVQFFSLSEDYGFLLMRDVSDQKQLYYYQWVEELQQFKGELFREDFFKNWNLRSIAESEGRVLLSLSKKDHIYLYHYEQSEDAILPVCELPSVLKTGHIDGGLIFFRGNRIYGYYSQGVYYDCEADVRQDWVIDRYSQLKLREDVEDVIDNEVLDIPAIEEEGQIMTF